jgi:hypothetical protein
MRVPKSNFARLRFALAASVMALLAAPALTQAAQPAASGYVPTMADYLAVYTALQNYRFGVEKHDQKALESAFWKDGKHIAVPSPGVEISMPLDGSPPTGGPPPGIPPMPAGAGRPGPGGPPPGSAPPPGFAPPPGANAGPPGPGGGEGEVWHLPLDSYIHFESATRATHYEYFLSIYPQPEKKPEGGNMMNMQNARTSIVGWPGHYEDILEKRNGEWRILQRKSMINQK